MAFIEKKIVTKYNWLKLSIDENIVTTSIDDIVEKITNNIKELVVNGFNEGIFTHSNIISGKYILEKEKPMGDLVYPIDIEKEIDVIIIYFASLKDDEYEDITDDFIITENIINEIIERYLVDYKYEGKINNKFNGQDITIKWNIE